LRCSRCGNHLEVNPQARIVVVSHARGVDFLMKGAKDANGAAYEDLVERLRQRGVRFDVPRASPKSLACSSARVTPT